MDDFRHVTVLREELVDLILTNPDGIYVDLTLGGGGHCERLLECAPNARVYGIDRDQTAIDAASKRLEPFKDRFVAIHGNFADIASLLDVEAVDGIMGDLGVSSPQLDQTQRGFSFMHDAPLDMRMDQSQPLTAYTVVNTYSEKELIDILYTYGEEKWTKRIVSFLMAARKNAPIETTGQLADIVMRAVPKGAWQKNLHPATRTFQAIRIEVNHELDALKTVIQDGFELLKPGGRMGFISFHSLEERIVKQAFSDFATGCTCPKTLPVCVCGRTPRARLITKKPVSPEENEKNENQRARSAKLRVLEKR